MKSIQKDIQEMKRDLAEIKILLREDFELSDEAKRMLAEAHAAPDSDYVDLDDV